MHPKNLPFASAVVAATFASLLGSSVAMAAGPEEPGIPLTVVVLDKETQAPVPTAVIRHPDEADPHRVNTTTGAWTASVLYLPTGEELVFAKDVSVTLEVSAPGYESAMVTYLMKKKKNKITVDLNKMNFELNVDEMDDVIIQFQRDKPIDGQQSDPAQ